jgi:hypothetical protein
MATFSQLPATLNIKLVAGDSLSIDIDFDVPLVGYSLTASVMSRGSRIVVAPMAVSVTSAQNGVVNVSMLASETEALSRGTYDWELTWTFGSVTRKALSGFFQVRNR